MGIVTLPTWWEFLLLALAAFRVTRLVGWDDLTAPLRWRLTGLGDEEHKQWAYVITNQRSIAYDPWDLRAAEGFWSNSWDRLIERMEDATGKPTLPPLVRGDQPWPPVSPRRFYLSSMLRCPWCAGFWISLATGVAWGGWVDAWLSGLAIGVPLSAVVGLIAKDLDR